MLIFGIVRKLDYPKCTQEGKPYIEEKREWPQTWGKWFRCDVCKKPTGKVLATLADSNEILDFLKNKNNINQTCGGCR